MRKFPRLPKPKEQWLREEGEYILCINSVVGNTVYGVEYRIDAPQTAYTLVMEWNQLVDAGYYNPPNNRKLKVKLP